MDKKSETERLIQPEEIEVKALLKQNSLLEVILDQIDAFIYVKDNKGRYKYMNQNYHELFNLSHDDWKGKSDSEFLDEDSAQKIRRNEQKVLTEGKPNKFEEIISVDGMERHFISYKVPLNNGTGYSNWICNFATEITGFKKDIPVLEGFEVSHKKN